MDINKIVFIAAMAFLAVRVYQKYIKKKNSSEATGNKETFSSHSKDEDYEPYSKG